MKKGITIIELLITIGISSMLLIMIMLIFSKTINNYSINMNYRKENFYINEAFIFIESKIEFYQDVEIVNNKIKLIKKDNETSDWIRMTKNGNIIISYDRCSSINSNNIVKNIEEFKVSKKENIMYISIKSKKGILYERCFGIKKQRDLY
ncbi:hypothetical protein CLOACE_01830 [Clostridium acetireducens DSM 10703]|uniref:Prepilin-type N-terminal cleavage/methylation domain-containing protein n=1 Tax=Clostridium acetireducens DSM 10703 TaxID=1121290 RepID=A0A1E8F2K5_9CLOT|nr:hypothetical protein [Clostridium acetireducens]OFI07579.1 hypothetical protein CLOACE_01830 [Clostridium acetireducens DSM 10703]